jgi:hypothetical protein
MYGVQRQVPIEYIFVEGLDALPKLVKSGERIVWFDYGTNLDADTIPRVFNTMEKDIRVVVFPSVVEGVDWDMFKKKTLAGSKEPVHQRALTFDTDVTKKVVGTDMYDVEKTSARVWVMDSKPIDKKLKSVQKNLSCDSYDSLFVQLKANNLRVVALPSALVIRHFTHKCLGNILEMPNVAMNP